MRVRALLPVPVAANGRRRRALGSGTTAGAGTQEAGKRDWGRWKRHRDRRIVAGVAASVAYRVRRKVTDSRGHEMAKLHSMSRLEIGIRLLEATRHGLGPMGGVALFWAEGGAPTVKNCTSPLDYVNSVGAWASSVPNVASPVV